MLVVERGDVAQVGLQKATVGVLVNGRFSRLGTDLSGVHHSRAAISDRVA